jgi:transcriptional regulator with PAS, ATPase and Fis domain
VAIEIKESLRETLEEAEKKIITRTLTEENNDKAKAARKLGLSRTTLYRKISMLGI